MIDLVSGAKCCNDFQLSVNSLLAFVSTRGVEENYVFCMSVAFVVILPLISMNIPWPFVESQYW